MPQEATKAIGKRAATKLAGLSLVTPAVERPIQPVVKTGVTKDCEDGLFIEGRMEGVPDTFLVDTGAIITIAKPSVIQ